MNLAAIRTAAVKDTTATARAASVSVRVRTAVKAGVYYTT